MGIGADVLITRINALNLLYSIIVFDMSGDAKRAKKPYSTVFFHVAFAENATLELSVDTRLFFILLRRIGDSIEYRSG